MTVDSYLAGLDDERRELVSAIRDTVNSGIDSEFQEMIDFGMITWSVPRSRYPDTYNGRPLMYAALASQKRHVSLYLMGCYTDPETEQWFQEEYAQTGKKLNMGKSCVRFRKLEDVPFELIEQAIARHTVPSYIEAYETARQ